jgi:hypothetical protein
VKALFPFPLFKEFYTLIEWYSVDNLSQAFFHAFFCICGCINTTHPWNTNLSGAYARAIKLSITNKGINKMIVLSLQFIPELTQLRIKGII